MARTKRNAPTDHPVIVWFRDDLRLADNRALAAAAATGQPVLAIYVFDEEQPRHPAAGRRLPLVAASQPSGAGGRSGQARHRVAHLSRSGRNADARARSIGQSQRRRSGAAATVAPSVPSTRASSRPCEEAGISTESCSDHLLIEPWNIKTQAGEPFKVFTPFWRAARAKGDPPAPLASPRHLRNATPPACTRAGHARPPRPAACQGPTGPAACARHGHRAKRAHASGLRISSPRTSQATPANATGPISQSPRSLRRTCASAKSARARSCTPSRAPPKTAWRSMRDADKFSSELGWREFSYHLLFHPPDLATANFDARFDAFPWVENSRALEAWQRGGTGFPIVDAGMRELWHTGYMHNRVRMIVASFLVKHLLIDWREGEPWFWDTLVDADPANNPASWQWVAGSGADAAPYFRIFNPVLQGTSSIPTAPTCGAGCGTGEAPAQAHPPALGRAAIRTGGSHRHTRPRLPAPDRCPRRGPRARAGRLRQNQAVTRCHKPADIEAGTPRHIPFPAGSKPASTCSPSPSSASPTSSATASARTRSPSCSTPCWSRR